MSLFPNYIYEYILSTFINYIFEQFHNPIILNNNEIINFSLVSKSFFDIVSKLLSNIKIKDYKLLDNLIESPKIINNNNNNGNYNSNNHSLIKTNNAVIVYNNLESFKKNIIDKNSNGYKRIILDLYMDQAIQVFREINTYPDNCEINLSLSSLEFYAHFIEGTKYRDTDLSKIKKINILERGYLSTLIDILKTNFDQCLYYYCSKSDDYGGLMLVFESFENGNGDLVKIIIDDLVFNQREQQHQHQQESRDSNNKAEVSLSKLKKFFFTTNIEYLLGKVGNSEGGSINSNNSNIWDLIISKLSKDPTLIQMHIENMINVTEEFREMVHKGFAKIISNPFSRIKTLSFNTLERSMSQKLIDALLINTSIREISLDDTLFPTIISKVLPKNKTIRNINIDIKPSNSAIGLQSLELLNNNNEIDLFSLTLNLYLPDISEYLKLVKTYSFQINQINIYNNYYFEKCKFEMYQVKLNNSFIKVINAIKVE